MKNFIYRHFEFFKSGDLTALKMLAFLPVSCLFVAVVFFIKPFLKVFLNDLNVVSMGVPVLFYERYFSYIECFPGLKKRSIFIFYYSDKKISNRYLLGKIAQDLPIVSSRFYWFWRTSEWLLMKTGLKDKACEIFSDLDTDKLGLIDKTKIHFKFSEKETTDGLKFLESLGVKEDSKIACLLVRDREYFKKYKQGYDDSANNYRCSSIGNYTLAIKALIERGYFVFRMGVYAEEPISFNHPRLIDYPFSGLRAEFLDVFIGSRCDFCVSTVSGWDVIPSHLFKKPMVFTNLVPLNNLYSYSDRFLLTTKKCFDRTLNRELSLQETAKLQFFNGYVSQQNADGRIQFIENTPEELKNVVLEMADRLAGTWPNAYGDNVLQEKFWNHFPKDDTSPSSGLKFHGVIRSRYSALYLRNHREWLG